MSIKNKTKGKTFYNTRSKLPDMET